MWREIKTGILGDAVAVQSRIVLIRKKIGGDTMVADSYGLVLAGGGGKGAYQIGVWKALKEYGVDELIKGVSGASVGALNTALFGAGDYELAEQVWMDIKPSQFLNLGFVEELAAQEMKGIFSREGLIQIIDEKLDLRMVSICEATLYANASRMVDGRLEPEYFMLNGRSDRLIKEILLASSALPAIYEPEKINGNWYQDGGLMDNVPILPLLMDEFQDIIVVTLGKAKISLKETYPDKNIILIAPSKSLGGFFDGTLDFTAAGAKKRLELGYEDGRRAMESLLE